MIQHNKKILALLCTFAVTAFLFGGCSSGEKGSSSEMTAPSQSSQPSAVPSLEAKDMVRVGALQGPTGLGLVKLMEDNDNEESANIYEFTLAGAPEEIRGKVINGDLDIAAVPTNMAAGLYAQTEGKVSIIAVNTLGVLYVLQKSDGEAVQTINDLAGKTVYSTGQGSTQEYVLEYLLMKNDLSDVTVEYKSEHAELATLMSEGKAELALLPQPFVTTVNMKDDAVKTVLDITKEWETATGTKLTMGCLVVRNEFLEKNKDAVDRFLEEYAASTKYVSDNVDEAAVLSGKYEVIKEDVAKLAIPKCNIVCITGEDMRTQVGAYLDVLYTAEPKSVGGTLPDDAFYYAP